MNVHLYSNVDSMAGHSGAVLCAKYCAEADLFVTGGDDHTLRLWPLGGGSAWTRTHAAASSHAPACLSPA